ncbi:TetR/AcrR family transcriptional regulator [Nocardiopsis terrae]
MTDRERARQRLNQGNRMSKGERTRQRIIDSATELFSRSGYRAVSLRDIAAHARLTHAGVLHHFPNKEATLIHVLSRRDAVDAPLVLDEGLTPRELIDNVVGIVERNTGTPGLVSLYVNLSAEATDPAHPAHEYFFGRYQILRGLLVPAFAALLDERAEPAPVPSPELAAQQFLALLDGLQVQWLLDPSAVDMRAAVVSFLRSLGIPAPDRGPGERPAPDPDDPTTGAADTTGSTGPADPASTTAPTQERSR